MIRKATLYTLESQIVATASDFVSWHEQNMIPDLRCSTSGELISQDVSAVRRVDARIHRVCLVERGVQTDSFIAMAPDVEEVLRMVVSNEYTKSLETRNRLLMQSVSAVEDRINQYNALPWYKRWFKKA